MVFFRMSLICLLVTSTCPFVWGWYAVDYLWDMEHFCIRASKARLQKWEPLSLIIARGLWSGKWCFLSKNWQQLGYHSFSLALLRYTWYIVYNNQNVLVTERTRKGSHKINAPHIKNFYFQNWVKGHHVLPCYPTRHLIFCTEFAKFKRIFK